MAPPMTLRLGLLLLCAPAVAAHPCDAEQASACPDTPAEDLGDCLKDSSQHEAETEISDECTNFMALNKACREDIEKNCDDNYFSDDVTPCLTQWTEADQLSAKCAGVLKWAVPSAGDAEEAEKGPTDELGMSDQDREEKEEWRAKRKAIREEAIGRMAMKEVDRKKEEDRMAEEKFKEDNPEEYAQMVQQQKEEERQKEAFAKKERAHMAAVARKQRAESGEEEEDGSAKKTKKAAEGSSFSTNDLLKLVFKLLFIGGLLYGGYAFVTATGAKGAKKAANQAGKKGKKRS